MAGNPQPLSALERLYRRAEQACRELARARPLARDDADLIRHRLDQNVRETIAFGETDSRRAERNEIIFSLHALLSAHDAMDLLPVDERLDRHAVANIVEDLLSYIGSRNISWSDPGWLVEFTRRDPPFEDTVYVMGLVIEPDDFDTALLGLAERSDRTKIVLSTAGFNSTQEVRLSNLGIRSLQLARLESAIGDFEDYVRYARSLSDVRQSADALSPSTYVPLRVTTTPNNGVSLDALETLNSWSNAEHDSLLCVLGEYGSGKTTLVERFTENLATQYSAGNGRLPILIRLGDFAGTPQVDSIIATWCSRYRTELTIDAFFHLCRTGRVVVIADGLDELQTGVTERELIRNVTELLRLCDGRGKLLVTSRSTYFQRYLQETGIFEEATRRTRLASGPADLTAGSVQFLHLEPFSRRDRVRLAEATLGKDAALAWLRRIRRNPQLERLSSTPLLLVLLLRDLVEDQITSGVAHVIGSYVDMWLRRDSLDYDLLLRQQDRERFAEVLAVHMFRQGLNSVHYAAMAGLVATHYGERAIHPRQLDYFDSELRTCTFLCRDPAGNFRFIHRIFQEFFTARAIVSSVVAASGNIFDDERIVSRLSAEGWRLIHEMIGEAWDVSAAKGAVEDRSTAVSRATRGLAVGFLHRASPSHEALRRLSDVIVHECSLRECRLEAIHWDSVDLDTCDLTGAQFTQISMESVSLRSALVRQCECRGGTIESSDFRNAYLDGSSLDSLMVVDTRFTRSSVQYGKIRNCTFRGCDFSGAALRDVVMRDVVFDDCIFTGADLRGVDLSSVVVDARLLNDAITN